MIVVGVVGLLAASYFASTLSKRGDRDVLVRVRVADGQTEDELFYDFVTVKKQVSREGLFGNQTKYTVQTVESADKTKLTFTDCTPEGVYRPVECKATDGKTYWVTLTEDAEA